MTWWMASLLANFSIATLEYLNRTAGFVDFRHALTMTAPFILLSQFGLFYTWRDAPSFMFAWAFFFAGNATMRLVNAQWFVGEPLSPLTLAGVGVIVAGACLVKMGST